MQPVTNDFEQKQNKSGKNRKLFLRRKKAGEEKNRGAEVSFPKTNKQGQKGNQAAIINLKLKSMLLGQFETKEVQCELLIDNRNYEDVFEYLHFYSTQKETE